MLNLFCRSKEFRDKLETSRERLYRVAFSWTHDADLADDLVQETLSRALKHGAKLREPKALNAWLFGILTNCWRDYLRSRRDSVEFDEEDYTHDITPEQVNARYQVVTSVRAAIARLPLGQRQVVTLVDLEGFSYAEVAEILEIPAGTVMSRLCRARRALKDALEHSGANEESTKVRLVRVK